ncbi:dual 3',5'-cyclic-AMP and -GMP phosphodiesterase 11 isoform X2 [Folsomia candida]|uniref:dual 3',5'-cyclic-AMP and -GMP phosphodiesterase 11 isoform X2 n=1 Tax=Folsomia candida TaxID=158441 RepID=UPI0016051635|nr:dual 3',5'-cyclic-AMP and -GMP phosphodiesterase 11 isoform X2 [Folsomia candida]
MEDERSGEDEFFSPECAKMEAWLDEHPEFSREYFIRKAPRDVIDSWLVAHSIASSSCSSSSQVGGGGNGPAAAGAQHHHLPHGNVLSLVAATGTIALTNSTIATSTVIPAPSSSLDHCPSISSAAGTTTTTQGNSGKSTCGSSGCTTPVRKISAQEFERGGLIKPMVTTVDGTPTFLTPPTSTTDSQGLTSRKSREELQALDEKELLFELAKDICDELDTRTLAYKILQHVGVLTSADRASLFLVQGKKGSGTRWLVSSLFDVCSQSTLADIDKNEEIRIPWGSGIVGYVAESGSTVNIADAYQDDRFNQEIDLRTGYKTKSLLCMPIKDKKGDCHGVAQVINKKDGPTFTKKDEVVFANYLQFCGIGLRNAQLYEQSRLENKRNQVLLDLARVIFVEQSTIEAQIYRILTHTLSIMQCRRAQVLLVHEKSMGTFSRVFDLDGEDMNDDDAESRSSPFEGRFPINIGITGYVATTGETVNIPNVYEDARFDPAVDSETEFKHRSILCMPIRNSPGHIIGVIQLINKFDSLPFSTSDEMFLEAFAIFCGMGINNTRMYEKAVIAMAKQTVTLEVLSYHASAPLEEAHHLRESIIPSAQFFRLHAFDFDDDHLDDFDTFRACLRMFLDLDLVKRFNIDYEVLCRWLLSVKKNYRKVIYHNWRHAFQVAQMMFSIVTVTKWWKVLGDLECLGLLIACLCHDLDHRGTNNSFQIKASSALAQLYSTSTMERHHFDICMMILCSQGNQILSQLSPDEYSRVISVIEDAILATDLAVYFKNRGAFMELIDSNSYNWTQDDHRGLLRGMLMTACDLAAITKPWEVEKRIAELVASEFFEQGDIEREKLKIVPIDMMNREKKDELPTMQIAFIDSICEPVYASFAHLSPKLQPLLDTLLDNRNNWTQHPLKEDEENGQSQSHQSSSSSTKT